MKAKLFELLEAERKFPIEEELDHLMEYIKK
jgi:hypothetical protein